MILEAENLCFSYGNGQELLRNINLSLQEGLTILLGPNGCGKSTLLRLLSGELTPEKGKILLNGKEIRSYRGKERAKRISVLLQNIVPALDYTVEELVSMGRSARLPLWGPPTEEDLRFIGESMKCFKVESLAKRTCNTLSGGERQRVLLSGVFANDPEIMLLDEPTSATDVAHTLLILEKLKEYSRKKTVFMICHDLTLSANLADRILLLRDGTIFADGTPEEVLTEENLERVYDTQFRILSSSGGAKAVLPVKRV